MKLTSETVLDGVATALRDQVSPQLADDFLRDAARMAQSLIAIVARGMDDAVVIRVEENARIRELLGQGAALVEGEFAQRLREAAASQDPSLRISQLDGETARLRLLLVELHAWAEVQDAQGPRALSADIWHALRDFEMARAPRA